MENEEERVNEEELDGERVLVPVRHEETIHKEESLEEPVEKAWKIPRRWHVY